jgi:hypothetical protein
MFSIWPNDDGGYQLKKYLDPRSVQYLSISVLCGVHILAFVKMAILH